MGTQIYQKGNLRGEKILYPDGIGYCIWQPLSEDTPDVGLSFDFTGEEINDLIGLLQILRVAVPDKWEEDDESTRSS